MTILDDAVDTTTADATIAEMSDELIFLIASAATDEQRKYAADLFRHFTREVARDAYRRGRQTAVAAPSEVVDEVADRDAGDAPTAPHASDNAVSIVPPVRWERDE